MVTWFVQGVLTSVVGNVLTGLLPQIGTSEEKKMPRIGEILDKDSGLALIFGKAAADVSASVSLDKRHSERIKAFLASPEAQSIIRQVFSSHLTPSSMGRLGDIREVFDHSLRRFVGKTTVELSTVSDTIFQMLLTTCNRALEVATARGVLAAHGAASAYRTRLLQDELANITSNLALLAKAKEVDLDTILDFEKKYRKQVANGNKYIIPPSVDSPKKVPVDQLYVASNFARVPRKKSDQTEELSVHDFLSVAYRAIILGNPGGGKSTFVRKLCHDLATHHAERRLAGREVTPILITLRDYGSEKKSRGLSIVDFVERNSNSDYQIPAPKGAFEYLLLNGRTAVVFDGLDELLETSDRQKITSDVELFADLYPAVPIIVTSREVGYEQAPLDESRFEIFRLAPFSEEQTEGYVRKWFAVSGELPPAEQKKRAAAFIEESQIVPDLRSNPLLLALMCTIYRGEGTIPRNRPDVYGKCAEMLFEKWDKRRGIHVPLPFEAHIRPAMNHLAHWIYADESLQSGVSESSLVEEATRYLIKWCFDDSVEAEAAARQFIEFCSGRAWVFTDTGTRKGGERLYQFTHRTFLEYFTAVHLVQTYRTPEQLGKLLYPRIGKREWDIVAQLSFQLKGKSFLGDADVLLGGLLSEAAASEPEVAWNFVHFATRCLDFIVPTPPLRRQITNECLARAIAWAQQAPLPVSPEPETGKAPALAIASLLASSVENRSVVADSLKRFAVQKILSGSPDEGVLCSEIALHLGFALRARRSNPVPEELNSFWSQISSDIRKECRPTLRELAKRDRGLGSDCVWGGDVTVEEFIAWHGVVGMFQDSPFVVLEGIRVSLADSILHSATAWTNEKSELPFIKRNLAMARAAGKTLLSMAPPWLDVKPANRLNLSYAFSESFPGRKAEKATEPIDVDPDTMLGVFLICAAAIEIPEVSERFLSMSAKITNPILLRARPLLLAKIGKGPDRKDMAEEIARLKFTPPARDFILRWLASEIKLVST